MAWGIALSPLWILTVALLGAWLAAICFAERGKMVLQLRSQFTRAEIEKATEALFDLFQIDLPAYFRRAAIDHLREQLHIYCDVVHRNSPTSGIEVLAKFDRRAQLLTVTIDNTYGDFTNGFILKIDAMRLSMAKGHLERAVKNGLARMA